MAFLKIIYIIFFFKLLFLLCATKTVSQLGICSSNESVSCSARFLPNLNASESDCLIHRSQECQKEEFGYSTSSKQLGLVELKAYPYKNIEEHPVLNITFSNIKWSVMRFRFSGGPVYFCREIYLSPKYQLNVEELFYDCYNTVSSKAGHPFLFEYSAEDENKFTQIRKFALKVPVYKYITKTTELQNYTPFLYVDVTEVPKLIVRWQEVPFPEVKYKVYIYRKDDNGGSEEIVSSNEKTAETFEYNTFPLAGKFYIKLQVLHRNCTKGLCGFSISPVIPIDDNGKITLLVGIVGCVILIPVFLFILWTWRRQCQPPAAISKLPVVLIIHTPSRASHLKSVIALTEYLREHCFVNAKLDQLDIPSSESKDPWEWCNDTFELADYVMVISSPPKCCNEEGIFRNMDLVALRFLQEIFSRNTNKCFFSVLLPYCTEKDIPKEVKNLRVFKLTRDLDKMLWYIHNGGKAPSFVDSIKIFLDRKPHGGKSDLNIKGACLLTAFEEAGFDQGKVCNCVNKKTKESDDDAEDESANFVKTLNQAQAEDRMNFRRENCAINSSQIGSMSSLLPKSESSGSTNELSVELTHGFPVDRLNNLLGESEDPPVIVIQNGSSNQLEFNIQHLSL